jgi:WD40 repeat protein
MLRICPILLSLLVAAHGAKCCSAQPPKDEKKQLIGEKAAKDAAIRLDAYGDPLPARALFRLGAIRPQHQSWLNHATFSPDGKILAAGSIGEKQVVLWEMPSGRLLRRLPVAGECSKRLLFSPDGRWLASIGGTYYENHYLHVWEVSGGKPVVHAEQAEKSWTAFAFKPDSTLLAVADAKDIRLWDLPAAKQRQRQRTPPGKALALTFAAGEVVALMDDANTLAVWEVQAGKKRYSFAGAAKASEPMGVKAVFSAAFSADGKLFAYGGSDSLVAVRDTENGRQRHRFESQRGAVCWVSFSADSQALLSCSWGDRPRLWDLANSREKLRLDGRGAATFGEFSPEGKRMAMGGDNGSHCVRLFDPATGKEVVLGPTHHGWIKSIAFSPDGKHLALTGSDSGARLWDVATGRQIRVFADQIGAGITSLSFSPVGKTLATAVGMVDAPVYLWDSQNGQLIRKIGGDGAGKGHVFFTPDGSSWPPPTCTRTQKEPAMSKFGK